MDKATTVKIIFGKHLFDYFINLGVCSIFQLSAYGHIFENKKCQNIAMVIVIHYIISKNFAINFPNVAIERMNINRLSKQFACLGKQFREQFLRNIFFQFYRLYLVKEKSFPRRSFKFMSFDNFLYYIH